MARAGEPPGDPGDAPAGEATDLDALGRRGGGQGPTAATAPPGAAELPGGPPAVKLPEAEGNPRREALVAEVEALQVALQVAAARLEAARLRLARSDREASAKAQMLAQKQSPNQWRDWVEGLPPDILLAILHKVVRSEEAAFAVRCKHDPTLASKPLSDEPTAAHGLLAFAMVCKGWRKAQLKVGPLRSRVSDVMAKGSVELLEWASEIMGCPKKRPRGDARRLVCDLRGMAALTGNLPVLERESVARWAAWTEQPASEEEARAQRQRAFAEQEIRVFELAARSGSLSVLRWLEDSSQLMKNCYNWAAERANAVCAAAAEAGHVHVLKEYNFTDDMTASCSIAAAGNNQVQVLEHLGRGSFGHPDGLLRGIAAKSGSKDVLLWLKDGLPWSADAWYKVFQEAAQGGHVHVLQWAAEEGPADDPAANFGPPPGMDGDWDDSLDDSFWESDDEYYETLSAACANGHANVLRWLSEFHGPVGALAMADCACGAVCNGHIEVLECLTECGYGIEEVIESHTMEGIIESAAGNPQSLPAWKWIAENHPTFFDAMKQVRKCGSTGTARVTDDWRRGHRTVTMICGAAPPYTEAAGRRSSGRSVVIS